VYAYPFTATPAAESDEIEVAYATGAIFDEAAGFYLVGLDSVPRFALD
jgi:hypothetical protein